MTNNRIAPIEINKEEFKKIGYKLVDEIANFLDTIKDKPVTKGESPKELQMLLGNSSLPENGETGEELISKATDLLLNHSLFNGHPKFMGFITSSPAPIGMFADLLAASVNPNVSAQILSPISTEIEKQTIKWICEFIGVSKDYGGLLVSGGNMANFTAFLASRNVKGADRFKEEGLSSSSKKMITYCSETTHVWVQEASVLFGNGSNSTRWIDTDSLNKLNSDLLEQTIIKDLNDGHKPFLVVATAGDVSTGTVDDLKAIAAICKKYDLWFHIDGAYGIPASVVPELESLFDGVKEADSIALDPHKWLYSPLEAGCILMKEPQHLIDTYSSHPVYYNFNEKEDGVAHNFYEMGIQNSRGFRALKVWLTLQHAGKSGFIKMISEDIELSELLFKIVKEHPELEAISQNLSIATFRYIPIDYGQQLAKDQTYLNTLNEDLLHSLQRGGEMFLSNAIISNKFCLRTCIVNFRTSKRDIEQVVEIVVREGKKLHEKLKKNH